MQSVTVPATNNAVVGIANPNGTRQYAGKNWLGIAERATNELEHLCSRTLLFSYRVQLAGKGLNLSFTPEDARNTPVPGC
jgi:hypothetical protein